MSEASPSTPILTVWPEIDIAFLWVATDPAREGVGSKVCDGMGWHESQPLSEGLFVKFMDWVLAYDSPEHLFYEFEDDWDWLAFHARGMHLSRWLKDEVGAVYRVVYMKCAGDPNQRLNERLEILADGSTKLLPSFRPALSLNRRICGHFISGGQTGADRAALDFAIEHGYTHGGSIPAGRRAEDGVIPLKYQLTELKGRSYSARTRRNVLDSDGTLIINLGPLDGGTRLTQAEAVKLLKPCLVIQLDESPTLEDARTALAWIRKHRIGVLNVAGPRESKRPGAYQRTMELLRMMHAMLSDGVG